MYSASHYLSLQYTPRFSPLQSYRRPTSHGHAPYRMREHVDNSVHHVGVAQDETQVHPNREGVLRRRCFNFYMSVFEWTPPYGARFDGSHFAYACGVRPKRTGRVVWFGVRLQVRFDRLSGCGGHPKPAYNFVCTLKRLGLSVSWCDGAGAQIKVHDCTYSYHYRVFAAASIAAVRQ